MKIVLFNRIWVQYWIKNIHSEITPIKQLWQKIGKDKISTEHVMNGCTQSFRVRSTLSVQIESLFDSWILKELRIVFILI